MTTTQIVQAVKLYRKGETGLRRLSGSTGATFKASRRHQGAVDAADSALRDLGEHHLRGLLNEEAALAARLRGTKDRPELSLRIQTVRKEIRSEMGRTR